MNNEVMMDLEQTLRAVAPVMRELSEALRLQCPQWYRVDDLMRRWAMSRNQVDAFLYQQRRTGGMMITGGDFRIHYRDVLELDRVLEVRRG